MMFEANGKRLTFSTLIDVLHWNASQQAERRAYTFLGDGTTEIQSWTYAQLEQRAQAIAAYLQDNGYTGQRALLLYTPGLDFIAAFFGCLYAGVVAVPTYPPQFKRTIPKLLSIMQDSQPACMLTATQMLSSMRPEIRKELSFERCPWITTDTIGDDLASVWHRPVERAETLAMLQYTSGSTSAPKGVMLTHKNLLHNSSLIARAFEITPDIEGVSWLPPYHDMGLIGGILQPLYSGFPVTLMHPVTFLQRPIRWLQAISRLGTVTMSGGPDFAYKLCTRKISAEERATLDLSRWELAFCGAEPVQAQTLSAFAETFASCGFRYEAFYPCYGLAEASLLVTGGKKSAAPRTYRAKRQALEQHYTTPASEDEAGQIMVGCGAVQGNQRVKIVDPHTLLPCPPQQVGEIWIAGPSVAQGYWEKSEQTQQTFQAYLADSETGPFLRTGDLGFLYQDELFLTGRIKDLIILRGRNYYPQDLELTVEQCHEGIRPGCVSAFSIQRDAEERLVIAAEVERRWHGKPLENILSAIRRGIAEAHEITPHTVLLLKPGAIPKTTSGKIQRHVCVEMFDAGQFVTLAESVTHAGSGAPFPNPLRNEILEADPGQRQVQFEAYLQHLLSQIIEVPLQEITPECMISSLGLDSLTALETQHRIELDLGIVIPLNALLDDLTLAQLAHLLLTHPSLLQANSPVTAPTPFSHTAPPLSYGQRALWSLQQVDEHNSAYNISLVLLSHTTANVDALQNALWALIKRHPILRTTFVAHGQEDPVQVIHPEGGDYFSIIDASAWDEVILKERLYEIAQQPFDLHRGPLFRIRLFDRYEGHNQVLMFVLHHSITDFWSLEIFKQELEQLYRAEITGIPARLPELTTTYVDYVRWQRLLIGSAEGEQHWEYWREQLSGTLPLLQLPTERPRPLVQTYRGSAQRLQLDQECMQSLTELARSQSVTLHTLLLTAYMVLLYRYSGQEELLVGTVTSGRSRADFAPLLGYFANPVVIRAHINEAPSFTQLLRQVRQTTLSAFAHQDYPFSLLVERLKSERSSGRSPIFQTLFIFQQEHLQQSQGILTLAVNDPGAQVMLHESSFEALPLEERMTPFDLTMRIAPVKTGLTVEIEYNSDLFDASTIQRMLEHFSVLLRHIELDPDQLVASLPLLLASEQRYLLRDLNATQQTYPSTACLHELFEMQADLTPEKKALLFGEQQMTYQELEHRANCLAHFLRKAGIGPEARVGLCMERSPEMVVSILSILKAGGAYVPLDPSYPTDRLHFMQRDSQIQIILTKERFASLAIEGLPMVLLDADWPVITQEPARRLSLPASVEQALCMLYTSGSTGRPKAVIELHSNILNRCFWGWQAYPLQENEVCCLKTASSFVDSLAELFSPLLRGTPTVIFSDELVRDPEQLVRALARYQVSRIVLVPSLLRILLGIYHDLALRLPSLQLWVSSGEPLPSDLVETFRTNLPGRTLVNLYGSAEVAADVTCYEIPREEMLIQRIPIGHPIANAQIYLLDALLNPVPVGIAGEVYIGGLPLARGYFNRPALTAEKFLPDPFTFVPGARLYKTGDLGRYRADGIIEYMGRVDQQVKLRGHRVEVSEIAALLSQHPLVHQAVVTAQEHAGEPTLVAYVEPNLVAADISSQGLQFSLFYFAENDALSDTDRYRLYTEGARFADAHGFTAVWTPERHFHKVAGLYPNPSVLNAALAMITERIQLRAGSVVLPLQHPLRVAEEWAVVDNLSKGRVGLAFTSGWVPNDFVFYPEHFAKKREVLFQGIQQVQRLWRGESIEAVDGVGKPVQIKVFPRPIQTELPIWLTCTSDPAQFEKAGELGLNVLTALLTQTVEEAAEKIALYRASLARHGHDPQKGHVTMMVHTFLGEDLEQTIARVRDPFCQYMKSHVGLIEMMVGSLELPIDFDAEKELDMLAELAFERYRRSAALLGTPGSCLPMIERLQAIGVDEIACLIDFGMSVEEVMHSLQLLDQLRQTSQLHIAGLPQTLRDSLQRQLPDYMLPRAIVQLDRLPLLPNGKVDYQGLPLPDLSSRETQTAYVKPRTETESQVVDIWQRILQIERIGIEDNFFALGGHSLLAVKVVAAARDTLQLDLPLQDLFQDPTPRGMAALIEILKAEEQAQIATISRLMQQIENLPMEEVEKLLRQKKTLS